MKKLICLISTQGKTSKQVTDEVWKAFQKYKKVEKQVIDNMNVVKNDKNNLDKKIIPDDSMQVMFFRKTPKYPKK